MALHSLSNGPLGSHSMVFGFDGPARRMNITCGNMTTCTAQEVILSSKDHQAPQHSSSKSALWSSGPSTLSLSASFGAETPYCTRRILLSSKRPAELQAMCLLLHSSDQSPIVGAQDASKGKTLGQSALAKARLQVSCHV
jgi:hypothetical protein